MTKTKGIYYNIAIMDIGYIEEASRKCLRGI